MTTPNPLHRLVALGPFCQFPPAKEGPPQIHPAQEGPPVTAPPDDTDTRPDTTGADILTVGGSLFVALLGFATSFDAVSTAVQPDFGILAPAVPLGIDAGILVSSGAYITLARRNEHPKWLRTVPHVLTAATIALNIAAGHTFIGRLAHGVMVAMWAVFIEAATHVARKRLRLETGGPVMDRIRRSRWLLSPIATFRLWRRMVLWEITDYAVALDRERTRLLTVTALRIKHSRGRKFGWLTWRFRVPAEDRVRLKMGMLTPGEVDPQKAGSSSDLVRSDRTPQTAGKSPRRPVGKKTVSRSNSRPTRPDVTGLIQHGHAILATTGKTAHEITREELQAAVRDRVGTCSTDRAGELLRVLQEEPVNGRPLNGTVR